MSAQRDLSISAVMGILLLGCVAALAQDVPATARLFQARIEGLTRAHQSHPLLKDLSGEQRIELLEFVVGNTLFVLLHEMGHVVIQEMSLPVLGRGESAADNFAALALLKIGSSFSHRVLSEASKGWFLSDRRDQQIGAKPQYYDEHNVSQQRGYQIVCLMVGSDPAKFKALADEAGMPEDRQESCKEDYAEASQSWDTVLKPHRRALDQTTSKIGVLYGDAEQDFEVFARFFREIQILEAVAQPSAADFAWPGPFTIEMRSCGGPDAAWSKETRTLWVCYNLAFDFAQLYSAYVPGGPPPASSKENESENRDGLPP